MLPVLDGGYDQQASPFANNSRFMGLQRSPVEKQTQQGIQDWRNNYQQINLEDKRADDNDAYDRAGRRESLTKRTNSSLILVNVTQENYSFLNGLCTENSLAMIQPSSPAAANTPRKQESCCLNSKSLVSLNHNSHTLELHTELSINEGQKNNSNNNNNSSNNNNNTNTNNVIMNNNFMNSNQLNTTQLVADNARQDGNNKNRLGGLNAYRNTSKMQGVDEKHQKGEGQHQQQYEQSFKKRIQKLFAEDKEEEEEEVEQQQQHGQIEVATQQGNLYQNKQLKQQTSESLEYKTKSTAGLVASNNVLYMPLSLPSSYLNQNSQNPNHFITPSKQKEYGAKSNLPDYQQDIHLPQQQQQQQQQGSGKSNEEEQYLYKSVPKSPSNFDTASQVYLQQESQHNNLYLQRSSNLVPGQDDHFRRIGSPLLPNVTVSSSNYTPSAYKQPEVLKSPQQIPSSSFAFHHPSQLASVPNLQLQSSLNQGTTQSFQNSPQGITIPIYQQPSLSFFSTEQQKSVHPPVPSQLISSIIEQPEKQFQHQQIPVQQQQYPSAAISILQNTSASFDTIKNTYKSNQPPLIPPSQFTDYFSQHSSLQTDYQDQFSKTLLPANSAITARPDFQSSATNNNNSSTSYLESAQLFSSQRLRNQQSPQPQTPAQIIITPPLLSLPTVTGTFMPSSNNHNNNIMNKNSPFTPNQLDTDCLSKEDPLFDEDVLSQVVSPETLAILKEQQILRKQLSKIQSQQQQQQLSFKDSLAPRSELTRGQNTASSSSLFEKESEKVNINSKNLSSFSKSQGQFYKPAVQTQQQQQPALFGDNHQSIANNSINNSSRGFDSNPFDKKNAFDIPIMHLPKTQPSMVKMATHINNSSKSNQLPESQHNAPSESKATNTKNQLDIVNLLGPPAITTSRKYINTDDSKHELLQQFKNKTINMDTNGNTSALEGATLLPLPQRIQMLWDNQAERRSAGERNSSKLEKSYNQKNRNNEEEDDDDGRNRKDNTNQSLLRENKSTKCLISVGAQQRQFPDCCTDNLTPQHGLNPQQAQVLTPSQYQSNQFCTIPSQITQTANLHLPQPSWMRNNQFYSSSAASSPQWDIISHNNNSIPSYLSVPSQLNSIEEQTSGVINSSALQQGTTFDALQYFIPQHYKVNMPSSNLNNNDKRNGNLINNNNTTNTTNTFNATQQQIQLFNQLPQLYQDEQVTINHHHDSHALHILPSSLATVDTPQIIISQPKDIPNNNSSAAQNNTRSLNFSNVKPLDDNNSSIVVSNLMQGLNISNNTTTNNNNSNCNHNNITSTLAAAGCPVIPSNPNQQSNSRIALSPQQQANIVFDSRFAFTPTLKRQPGFGSPPVITKQPIKDQQIQALSSNKKSISNRVESSLFKGKSSSISKQRQDSQRPPKKDMNENVVTVDQSSSMKKHNDRANSYRTAPKIQSSEQQLPSPPQQLSAAPTPSNSKTKSMNNSSGFTSRSSSSVKRITNSNSSSTANQTHRDGSLVRTSKTEIRGKRPAGTTAIQHSNNINNTNLPIDEDKLINNNNNNSTGNNTNGNIIIPSYLLPSRSGWSSSIPNTLDTNKSPRFQIDNIKTGFLLGQPNPAMPISSYSSSSQQRTNPTANLLTPSSVSNNNLLIPSSLSNPNNNDSNIVISSSSPALNISKILTQAKITGVVTQQWNLQNRLSNISVNNNSNKSNAANYVAQENNSQQQQKQLSIKSAEKQQSQLVNLSGTSYVSTRAQMKNLLKKKQDTFFQSGIQTKGLVSKPQQMNIYPLSPNPAS